MATTMYTLKPHYIDSIVGQWDMAHDLINTAKQAKGVPLSAKVNPYREKLGNERKVKIKN